MLAFKVREKRVIPASINSCAVNRHLGLRMPGAMGPTCNHMHRTKAKQAILTTV